MMINCAKCSCVIADVKAPSTVKKGAKLSGLCYVCQTKNMAQGKPASSDLDYEGIMKSFNDIFNR